MDFGFALATVGLGATFALAEAGEALTADFGRDATEVREIDRAGFEEVAAGSRGIEFWGGCSFWAISGNSSDFSSCGEREPPLFRHFDGLSAQAST